jgi:hypothetical protein
MPWLPAAIAAREAERGVMYLDGARVGAIIAEQMARDTGPREGSAYVN